jgi:hypothetical protein
MKRPDIGMPGAILALWVISLAPVAALASESDEPPASQAAGVAPSESERTPSLSTGQAVTAATSETAPADISELTMTVGTGVVIDCPSGISRLAASSPEIVDAVTASTKEVLFHAKSLGRATMIIWSKAIQRDGGAERGPPSQALARDLPRGADGCCGYQGVACAGRERQLPSGSRPRLGPGLGIRQGRD